MDMVDTFETITCELAGPVATVTLNRPDVRNAMSHRMIDESAALLHYAPRACPRRACAPSCCAPPAPSSAPAATCAT